MNRNSALSKSLLLVGLSFLCFPSFAQDENSIGFFIASPVGSFKSTDLNGGGFAKTGWGIVFDSRGNLGSLKGWSYYSHSTFQWNEMDTETMEQKFTDQLGNRTEISDSKYSPFLTTIGPAYQFDLSEKVKLSVMGSVGIVLNNTKAFTVKVYDASDNLIADELVNFSDDVAFAYSLGLEVKIELIKDLLGLALFSDYTSANQKTELTFSTASPVDSFEELRYVNTGFKLVVKKKSKA